MARIIKPLSSKEIKAAKPRKKLYRLYDGNGLLLEIPSKGNKRWRFRYSFNGSEKMISLGVYPKVTLKKARELRDEMQSIIVNGKDPSVERKEAKKAEKKEETKDDRLFSKVADAWLKEELDPVIQYINKLKRADPHATINEKLIRKKIEDENIKVRRTPSEPTIKRHISILNNDILPAIGNMVIDEIVTDDIRSILANIMGRGATETAHRALSQIKNIWIFAITSKITDRNIPADIIAKAELVEYSHKNFRTIIDPKEISMLMHAIDDYSGENTTRAALKFLVLTAARPGNVRAAEWSEINFKEKLWAIPSEKMKMRKPHIIPLSKQAIDILLEIKKINGNSIYIFPSSFSTARILSENTMNVALKRLDFGNKIVSHGFRSMFSTIANNSGRFNRDIIDKALAHKLGDTVEQTYNRADYLEERIILMQWWADYLDEIKVKYEKN